MGGISCPKKESAPRKTSSLSYVVVFALLVAGVIVVFIITVIVSRFGPRRPLPSTNHLASTNEVAVTEIDPKVCAVIQRKQTHKSSSISTIDNPTPVIVMESTNVLMERNDIGNLNHFFKDEFYPLAVVLANHFNQSTCRLFGDFMNATNVETTRYVSSVAHASTRSFFMRSLLSHICKEESFQEVYQLGTSSFPLRSSSMGSTTQDAASCQCLVERTAARPPPERYLPCQYTLSAHNPVNTRSLPTQTPSTHNSINPP